MRCEVTRKRLVKPSLRALLISHGLCRSQDVTIRYGTLLRMSTHTNLFGEPPATLLPPTPEAEKMLAEGKPAVEVAAEFPTFSLAWALLAELALDGDRFVEGYAYARTGYHRGLDALRRNGWKGHGPIPWSHEPNRGFLRCLAALARAADAIGEVDEAQRCWTFLADSSAEAAAHLKP